MEKKIKLTKEFIEQQLEYPIGMEAIAENLGTSYHTLRKQFREFEGKTMGDYYNKRRLEIALIFLQNSDMLIYQVAYSVGFSSSSNFARWFKKETGLSPGIYKRQFRQKDSLVNGQK